MPSSKAYDLKGRRIWITGHRGMLGSAFVRRLKNLDCEVLTADRGTVNLFVSDHVEKWIKDNKPEVIINCAARVGGIGLNIRVPASMIFENVLIQANVINAANQYNVERLVTYGSSCSYPAGIDRPIRESDLLAGRPEITNLPYAMAKLTGVIMTKAFSEQFSRNYTSIIPTNTYGPCDNFNLEDCHVIPALIRKIHEAKLSGVKKITLWGTGRPLREFIYIDDLVDASIHIIEKNIGSNHINVGTGQEITIADLAKSVSWVLGYTGAITFDTTRPDGVSRKCLDSSWLRSLGWTPSISLQKGLEETVNWYFKEGKSE